MKAPFLRWGILGTGSIARRFARALAESQTGRLAAAGSRTEEAVGKFLKEFPGITAHASYEALLADENVDVIYICTPHPMHAQWAIKAAEAGKHILCEKPLTLNYAEAVRVIDAARAAGVFLMEAFMYRCHPQTARLVELIREGRIGEVRLIQATFSFLAGWNLRSRLLSHSLGGGGILDVGCYCASLVRLVAGAASGQPFLDPSEVRATGQIGGESRVDEVAIASLKFPNGVLAQLTAGVRLSLDNFVRIWGEEGDILVPSPWSIGREPGASRIVLHKDGRAEEIVINESRDVYSIEADTVAHYISAGQNPAMSWADTLGNMRTLDRWRAEIGFAYDSEKPAAAGAQPAVTEAPAPALRG